MIKIKCSILFCDSNPGRSAHPMFPPSRQNSVCFDRAGPRQMCSTVLDARKICVDRARPKKNVLDRTRTKQDMLCDRAQLNTRVVDRAPPCSKYISNLCSTETPISTILSPLFFLFVQIKLGVGAFAGSFSKLFYSLIPKTQT